MANYRPSLERSFLWVGREKVVALLQMKKKGLPREE
jgi:hypothetical protein